MKDSGTADIESRFGFGRNWQRFLTVLNEERIRLAVQSLRDMLGIETLKGRTFLDVGSGSGLFSLAAMRLGATRVHSFDYDRNSVECARELRQRFFPGSINWSIEEGSVLDREYLKRLGTWDVVYSWGVLHHTGDMYQALENVTSMVAESGHLLIALYNDQGAKSRAWWSVKRLYNRSTPARLLILGAFLPYCIVGGFAADAARRRNPLVRYRAHVRGMSHIHDWIDWLGGFPFEVASREAVISYFRERSLALERMISCGDKHGCNEFLFKKCELSS